VAAGLATLIIVTVMMAEPAKAAFPGTNGKIAFDSVLPGQADSEIVTVTDNPATGAVQDEPTPLTNNGVNHSAAAWSSDGSKIAFGRNSDIWAMNSDSTKQIQLTSNASLDSNPT
jgi:Tol biopolymer transport system component